MKFVPLAVISHIGHYLYFLRKITLEKVYMQITSSSLFQIQSVFLY
jgi:hypothetical protein